MKKIISAVAVILCAAVIFGACSKSAPNSKNKAASKSTSSSAVSGTSGSNAENEISDSPNPVDKASVSAADASKIIKNLDEAQLGIDGKKDDYKFLVAEKGKSTGGKDYIEVDVAKVTKENKDGSINMDTVSQFLISYDGKTIMRRDMKTGTLTEIKQ